MGRTLQARSGGGAASDEATSDLLNQPGTFMMVPVADLRIDTEYQRAISGGRVDRMAADWNWIACGVITVALRGPGSGEYYVIDGQHRVVTAERVGIVELPCMVFESKDHRDEAQGFLDTNISRRPMSILDRYRALLVVGDPVALRVKEHLEEFGKEAAFPGGKTDASRATKVGCIDTMMNCVRVDDEVFSRIWPLINKVADGKLVTKKLIAGMFYLERYLVNTSIVERHWSRRFLQVGYDLICKSIDETVAFEGRFGAAIAAQGILRAVNRGLRNKLTVKIEGGAAASEEETDG